MANYSEYREAEQITGKQGQKLFDWMQSFSEDYIVKKETVRDGEDVFTSVKVAYTDGDDGLMVFSSGSEIFDDDGVSVSVIGFYCDISYETMQNIMFEMEQALKTEETLKL